MEKCSNAERQGEGKRALYEYKKNIRFLSKSTFYFPTSSFFFSFCLEKIEGMQLTFAPIIENLLYSFIRRVADDQIMRGVSWLFTFDVKLSGIESEKEPKAKGMERGECIRENFARAVNIGVFVGGQCLVNFRTNDRKVVRSFLLGYHFSGRKKKGDELTNKTCVFLFGF